jgi:hypothetical protein
MKLAQISSALILASTLITSIAAPQAKAEDFLNTLAGKVQCSDTALGQDTQMDVTKRTSDTDRSKSGNNSAWGKSSSSSAYNNSKSAGGGGGASVSFLGIGGSIGGSGSSSSKSSGNASESSSYGKNSSFNNVNKAKTSYERDKSSSTTVVGKNCDSNNAAAADMFKTYDNNRTDVKINEQNQDTERRRIDASERMNRDNNSTQVQMQDSGRRTGHTQNLLRW